MQSLAQHELVDEGPGGARLVLSGRLTLANIGPLERELRQIDGPLHTVDLAQVEEIDTVGAYVVCKFARAHESDIAGASPAAERLLAAVRDIDSVGDNHPHRMPVWERVPAAVGEKVFGARGGAYCVVAFLGQIG
ncbi:MAG: lipid asymmetry maintenance protein MlaB, partial [Erythrobacter sp.]